MCINGDKSLNFSTIWDELSIDSEFPDLQYLNLTEESGWNTVRDKEMERTLTPAESTVSRR